MLVVRKDLKMRKGKIAAQCAHASMKVLLDMRRPDMEKFCQAELDDDFLVIEKFADDAANEEWLFGLFTKVCVSVDSEAELLEAVEKARAAGIPVALITDAGKTEFHGVPTNTVAAIGPATAEALAPITGEMKLL
jgi:PTH2 family peptidyl-tRNA hydrolase